MCERLCLDSMHIHYRLTQKTLPSMLRGSEFYKGFLAESFPFGRDLGRVSCVGMHTLPQCHVNNNELFPQNIIHPPYVFITSWCFSTHKLWGPYILPPSHLSLGFLRAEVICLVQGWSSSSQHILSQEVTETHGCFQRCAADGILTVSHCIWSEPTSYFYFLYS